MTSPRSASTNAKTRSATRRIESFRQRFGDGHFCLACHAALPLALTPDLLYSLWANFQQDRQGEAIEIPWIAVADLMLSNLCQEVGNELYEMDALIRDELLTQLQGDSRFGLERLRELADFVMAYVEQQLESPDLDVRDLATGQQWRALAYKNPAEAAHKIAAVLAQLPLSDKAEWIRMAALTDSLSEPLSAFQSLLDYTRAMAALARGNLETATVQMAKAVDANNQVQVEGINLPIPDVLNQELPQSIEQNPPVIFSPNRFVKPIVVVGGVIIIVVVGGVIISLLGFFLVLSRSRLPDLQGAPTSSLTPTPQTSSSSPIPTPQSSSRISPSPSPTLSPSPSSTLPQSTPSLQPSSVISQASPPSRSLDLGSRNSEVADLQGKLAQLGYYNLPIDGIYGSALEYAVRKFQQDVGLYPDGVYGSDSASALQQVLTGGVGGSTSTLSNNSIKYAVVIPAGSEAQLYQVRRYVPGAFIRSNPQGNYVQAYETFDRSSAIRRANNLRSLGFGDVQVKVFNPP